MPNFAIHDGARVVNVIVADSVEVAESITGLTALETSGEPWVGWTLESEGWRRPSPFPSWVWSGTEWEAPIAQPVGDFLWDEDSQDWVPRPSPFPSWVWVDGKWTAPVPMPSDDIEYEWDEDTLSWVQVGP